MTTALIVIDVQESFRQRPLWRTASNPEIVSDVNRLVEAARSRGDQVIWVLHAEAGSGGTFDPASGLVRLMDGLKALDDEPVLTKTAHNAFTTTNLQQRLVSAGVSHVVDSASPSPSTTRSGARSEGRSAIAGVPLRRNAKSPPGAVARPPRSIMSPQQGTSAASTTIESRALPSATSIVVGPLRSSHPAITCFAGAFQGRDRSRSFPSASTSAGFSNPFLP